MNPRLFPVAIWFNFVTGLRIEHGAMILSDEALDLGKNLDFLSHLVDCRTGARLLEVCLREETGVGCWRGVNSASGVSGTRVKQRAEKNSLDDVPLFTPCAG